MQMGARTQIHTAANLQPSVAWKIYWLGLRHHLNGSMSASQSLVSLILPAVISAERQRRQREAFPLRPVMTPQKKSAEGKCMQTALSSNDKSTKSVFLCCDFNLIATIVSAEWLLLRTSAAQRTRSPNSGPLKVPVEGFQRLIKLDDVNDYCQDSIAFSYMWLCKTSNSTKSF